MRKYPRTAHIRGSRFQHGDEDLEAVPWNDLTEKRLTVEEKVDGANAGISFSETGELLLQSRGHYLRGGPREKHFNILKQWAAARTEELYCVLGERYIMYGEWLYAKHTCFYDALPHYFMEFDVLDTISDTFLSTEARQALFSPLPSGMIVPVRVLEQEKRFNKLSELENLLGRSAFITDNRQKNFLDAAVSADILSTDSMLGNKEIQEALAQGDWDPLMEGLYVKWEEDGIVKGRYKYVRPSFTNSILDQETHWHDRPIVVNMLLPGAFGAMFA